MKNSTKTQHKTKATHFSFITVQIRTICHDYFLSLMGEILLLHVNITLHSLYLHDVNKTYRKVLHSCEITLHVPCMCVQFRCCRRSCILSSTVNIFPKPSILGGFIGQMWKNCSTQMGCSCVRSDPCFPSRSVSCDLHTQAAER